MAKRKRLGVKRSSRRSATLSLADLHRLVAERERRVAQLQARRLKVEAELAALDAELASAQGHAAPYRAAKAAAPAGRKAATQSTGKKRGRRGLGKGGKTIGQALADIIKAHGKPMRVPEMAKAFRASGHPTQSKNLTKLISMAIKNSNQIKRVSRGLYAVK